jgi:ubiquinone biosynthesis protein UbiJ
MAASTATEWLQSAINAALTLDPEVNAKLAQMSGSVIRVKLKLIERELYLFPRDNGIDISSEYDGEPDTTISGTPLALLKMGLSKQVAPMLLKGDVSIEGNAALGREFKKLLASMDIDWEEIASRMVGDMPAHHVFKALRRLHGWSRKSVQSVIRDTSEYVQEESRDVVSAAELEAFYKQVDELRDAVARIEKDIQKINTSSAS